MKRSDRRDSTRPSNVLLLRPRGLIVQKQVLDSSDGADR